MNQQTFWNCMSDDPTEIQNLPVEGLSSSHTDMCYESVSNEDIGSTDICDSQGPSSNLPLLSNANLDEFNLQIGWTSSMAGGVPRLDEDHSKAITTLPSVNVDIDLNRNHVDNGHSILEGSGNDISPHNSGYAASDVATSSQVLRSDPFLQPSNLVVPRYRCSNSCAPGSSSRAVQLFSQSGGRRRAIPNDHSVSLKRKNVEVAPGPLSTSGSSSRSGNCLPFYEDINVQINNTNQAMASGNDPFGNEARNEETFQRNTRMRISHACPFDSISTYIWPQGIGISYPNNSSAHHSVSITIPSDTSLVSSRSANNGCPYIQSHAPSISLSSNFHPFTLNGAPIARVGSSSSQTFSGGRPVMGEARSGTTLRNDTIMHPPIAPVSYPRPLDPERINLSLANGTAAVSRDVVSISQSSSNVGVLPPGANWAPSQHHLDLLESLQFHPLSGGSEPRGPSGNLLRRNHGPASEENVRDQTVIVPRVRQQPAMRSSHLIGRQNGGLFGIPVPSSLTAVRERRRMRTELRNMFDQIRRAEIPPQDLILINGTIFLGGADFLDRYRDLRLDVDNMSYEELLALEEQIGNVSTGLTEEKIRKCLSPSKYLSITAKEAEPCCI